MKITELTPEFSHYLPEEIQEGKLYISLDFGTSKHLCPCGCGSLIVVPFSIDNPNQYQWHYTQTADNKISLSPSVGNWQIPCQYHYMITENKIVLCP